ncbi:MAG: hypothetical protein GC193_09370 [Cryomorphaceae bacterium]|nr:hypothetical protein [Cryomorphaceae bacterium]
MREDIEPPKVTDVAVAVVQRFDEINNEIWEVYLLNLKDIPLEVVLIRSSGYGMIEGHKIETTELRRHIELIEPKSCLLIEPIQPEVFALSNQYWVSFYIHKVLYDKKYIFVPGSIEPRNFITVPLIEEQGVMIK